MKKYKIIFVDEQQEDIDSFLDYIEERDKEGAFEVLTMYPLETLENMVDEIFSKHADAVITDYMLNEYKDHIDFNIPYTGTQLVKNILLERDGFPCFVMTSFDDQAISESSDVNIVYIKGILHGNENETKAKATFLDRLKSQINHYRANINTSEQRLLQLIEISKTRLLDAPEEEEIIRLDDLIEKSLDKKHSIPKISKEQGESKSLSELIRMVDELNKKLDNTNE